MAINNYLNDGTEKNLLNKDGKNVTNGGNNAPSEGNRGDISLPAPYAVIVEPVESSPGSGKTYNGQDYNQAKATYEANAARLDAQNIEKPFTAQVSALIDKYTPKVRVNDSGTGLILSGTKVALNSSVAKELRETLQDALKYSDLKSVNVSDALHALNSSVAQQIEKSVVGMVGGDYQKYKDYANAVETMKRQNPMTLEGDDARKKYGIWGYTRDGKKKKLLPKEWIDLYRKEYNAAERAALYAEAQNIFSIQDEDGEHYRDYYLLTPYLVMSGGKDLFENNINENGDINSPVYGFDLGDNVQAFFSGFGNELLKLGRGIAKTEKEVGQFLVNSAGYLRKNHLNDMAHDLGHADDVTADEVPWISEEEFNAKIKALDGKKLSELTKEEQAFLATALSDNAIYATSSVLSTDNMGRITDINYDTKNGATDTGVINSEKLAKLAPYSQYINSRDNLATIPAYEKELEGVENYGGLFTNLEDDASAAAIYAPVSVGTGAAAGAILRMLAEAGLISTLTGGLINPSNVGDTLAEGIIKLSSLGSDVLGTSGTITNALNSGVGKFLLTLTTEIPEDVLQTAIDNVITDNADENATLLTPENIANNTLQNLMFRMAFGLGGKAIKGGYDVVDYVNNRKAIKNAVSKSGLTAIDPDVLYGEYAELKKAVDSGSNIKFDASGKATIIDANGNAKTLENVSPLVFKNTGDEKLDAIGEAWRKANGLSGVESSDIAARIERAKIAVDNGEYNDVTTGIIRKGLTYDADGEVVDLSGRKISVTPDADETVIYRGQYGNDGSPKLNNPEFESPLQKGAFYFMDRPDYSATFADTLVYSKVKTDNVLSHSDFVDVTNTAAELSYDPKKMADYARKEGLEKAELMRRIQSGDRRAVAELTGKPVITIDSRTSLGNELIYFSGIDQQFDEAMKTTTLASSTPLAPETSAENLGVASQIQQSINSSPYDKSAAEIVAEKYTSGNMQPGPNSLSPEWDMPMVTKSYYADGRTVNDTVRYALEDLPADPTQLPNWYANTVNSVMEAYNNNFVPEFEKVYTTPEDRKVFVNNMDYVFHLQKNEGLSLGDCIGKKYISNDMEYTVSKEDIDFYQNSVEPQMSALREASQAALGVNIDTTVGYLPHTDYSPNLQTSEELIQGTLWKHYGGGSVLVDGTFNTSKLSDSMETRYRIFAENMAWDAAGDRVATWKLMEEFHADDVEATPEQAQAIIASKKAQADAVEKSAGGKAVKDYYDGGEYEFTDTTTAIADMDRKIANAKEALTAEQNSLETIKKATADGLGENFGSTGAEMTNARIEDAKKEIAEDQKIIENNPNSNSPEVRAARKRIDQNERVIAREEHLISRRQTRTTVRTGGEIDAAEARVAKAQSVLDDLEAQKKQFESGRSSSKKIDHAEINKAIEKSSGGYAQRIHDGYDGVYGQAKGTYAQPTMTRTRSMSDWMRKMQTPDGSLYDNGGRMVVAGDADAYFLAKRIWEENLTGEQVKNLFVEYLSQGERRTRKGAEYIADIWMKRLVEKAGNAPITKASLAADLDSLIYYEGVSRVNKWIARADLTKFAKRNINTLDSFVYRQGLISRQLNNSGIMSKINKAANMLISARAKSLFWGNFKNGVLQSSECIRLFTEFELGDALKTIKRLASDIDFRAEVDDWLAMVVPRSFRETVAEGADATRISRSTAEAMGKIANKASYKNGVLNIEKLSASDLKELGKSFDEFASSPVEFGEQMKNRVLMAGILQEAQRKGLSGNELFNYVNKRFERIGLAANDMGKLVASDNPFFRIATNLQTFGIRETNMFVYNIIDANTERGVGGAISYIMKNLGWKAGLLLIMSKLGYGAMSVLGVDPFGLMDDQNTRVDEEDYNWMDRVVDSPATNALFSGGFTSFLPKLYWASRQAYEGQVSTVEGAERALDESRQQFGYGWNEFGGLGWDDIRNIGIGFIPGYTQTQRVMTMTDLLNKGWAIGETGLKKYEAPTNPFDVASGYIFGASNTPQARAYNQNPDFLQGFIDNGWAGVGQQIGRVFGGYRQFDPIDQENYTDWFNGTGMDEAQWRSGYYHFRDEADKILENYTNETRNAYNDSDKQKLKENYNQQIRDLERKLRAFTDAYVEKNPKGFDEEKMNNLLNILNSYMPDISANEADALEQSREEWYKALGRYAQTGLPAITTYRGTDEGTETIYSPQYRAAIQGNYGLPKEAANRIKELYDEKWKDLNKQYRDKFFKTKGTKARKAIQNEYIKKVRQDLDPIVRLYGGEIFQNDVVEDIVEDVFNSMIPKYGQTAKSYLKELYKNYHGTVVYSEGGNHTLSQINKLIDAGKKAQAKALARTLVQRVQENRTSLSRRELERLQEILND